MNVRSNVPGPARGLLGQGANEPREHELEQGRAAGDLQFAGTPLEVARLLVSSLEGAMLVARSFEDVSRFQSISDRLLTDLSAADPRPAPSASWLRVAAPSLSPRQDGLSLPCPPR
jgi:hypothetical protein